MTTQQKRGARIMCRLMKFYALSSRPGCQSYTLSPAELSDLLEVPADLAPGKALGWLLESGYRASMAKSGGVTLRIDSDVGSDDVREVFEYWQKQTGKIRTKLLPARKSRIRARLREFSKEDLKRAIDALASSDFHRGNNDRGMIYLDIEQIIRSGERVEYFLQRAEKEQAESSDNVFDLMSKRYG